MKVALLSILFLVQSLAIAQDCADCTQKKLPTPLEETTKDGLIIVEKLQKESPLTVVCMGQIACTQEIDIKKLRTTKVLYEGILAGEEKKLEELMLISNSSSSELDKQKNLIKYFKDVIATVDKKISGNYTVQDCLANDVGSISIGKCGLEQQELEMISYYTKSGYSCLNTYLREASNQNDKINEIVKILNDGLTKLPNYQGFVRRGVSLPQEIRDTHKVGSVVKYPYFVSTSTGYGFEREDIFYILSKTGKPVMDLSNLKKEYEVLFKAGTSFKVLSVEKVDGVNYYVMKEVSSGEKSHDDAEDKEILSKVKTAPNAIKYEDGDSLGSDEFSCPTDTKSKLPESIEQKQMPGFKVEKVMEEP